MQNRRSGTENAVPAAGSDFFPGDDSEEWGDVSAGGVLELPGFDPGLAPFAGDRVAPLDPGDLALMRDQLEAEAARLDRIEAGIEHQCVVCGCSESASCPGGCIWAKPNLCSRCARTATEAYYGG